jgi:hypothetical protein
MKLETKKRSRGKKFEILGLPEGAERINFNGPLCEIGNVYWFKREIFCFRYKF